MLSMLFEENYPGLFTYVNVIKNSIKNLYGCLNCNSLLLSRCKAELLNINSKKVFRLKPKHLKCKRPQTVLLIID